MRESTSFGERTRRDRSENLGTDSKGVLVPDGGYKMLGELDDPDGTGVLGRVTAETGTTYGVRGEVSSPSGYGLFTPDDARVDGDLFTSTALNVRIGGGRVLTIDISGDGATVVAGAHSNDGSGVRTATIAGGEHNSVQADFGTISGGGPNDLSSPSSTSNVVYDNYGTIGGGADNQAGNPDGDPTYGPYATVSGGLRNEASDEWTAIGGGKENVASDHYATVGGGRKNTASGHEATIAGGRVNTADGLAAAVPGGDNNVANGNYSLAAGREAKANHQGSIVFGDSSSTEITSNGSDEVRSQMPMYAPDFHTVSTRTAKTDVDPVDPEAVLDGVESLDVSTWEFADTDDGRHMGPMAEDFHETFGLSDDGETIATVDADGVALAAIQGLSERLADRDELIEELETRLAEKDRRLDELESRLDALEAGAEPAGGATADD